MIDEETNTLIARWYLSKGYEGIVGARDFSDWAISKLEEGRDTGNLRMLASMFNEDVFAEVESHFRKALSELGWSLPPSQESVERYSRSIASQIVNDEITPFEGCRKLHDINSFLDYPPYLYNWTGLYWAGDDLTPGEHDDLIREEAERLLRGEIPDPLDLMSRLHGQRKTYQKMNFFERIHRYFSG